MKILITGFDPFGNDAVNASMEAVLKLPDFIGSTSLIKKIIPTIADKAMEHIVKYMEEYQSDIIISIGQASGRKAITLERIGINVDDFTIPDNANHQPVNQPIVKDGPDAYLCQLPIKKMVAKIKQAGILAEVSNSAGTFVCNHVCYMTAHLLKQRNMKQQSMFIHIPALPIQVENQVSSMPLDQVVLGLEVALKALVENTEKLL